MSDFQPTEQQTAIIGHRPSAFISACPGAGKTKVMVERARHLLKDGKNDRGIAFLSFTNAAVSELEVRLRAEHLLASPPFPHFIGTFDSFLWQFLVAPFGVDGTEKLARLIPDKDARTITPFQGARAIPLKVFDRDTGAVIERLGRELGFTPQAQQARAYATAAMRTRASAIERGELDFEDARAIALSRCNDAAISARLGPALAARFLEVIVDEAQDCNPADLDIIKWLRDAGIPTKLICDPHQSIYEFRGGVTEQLVAFKNTFEHPLSMHGNFRSTPNICKAITALRPLGARENPDQALGKHRHDETPVYVLSYPAGGAVPASIGIKVSELANELGIALDGCPILAATRASGSRAIGQPPEVKSEAAIVRLANAVTDYQFSFSDGNRRAALESLHKCVLSIEGHLVEQPYHHYLIENDLKAGAWRPRIIALAQMVRYDPAVYADTAAWHAHAKQVIAPGLLPNIGTINQRMPHHQDLAGALAAAPAQSCPAKTIHSVKGLEYDGACVVMTKQTAKGIIDFLTTGAEPANAENAREIYVAASRARRFLAIAVPSSQAVRLSAHLATTGTAIMSISL
jgi:hypothetical protein